MGGCNCGDLWANLRICSKGTSGAESWEIVRGRALFFRPGDVTCITSLWWCELGKNYNFLGILVHAHKAHTTRHLMHSNYQYNIEQSPTTNWLWSGNEHVKISWSHMKLHCRSNGSIHNTWNGTNNGTSNGMSNCMSNGRNNSTCNETCTEARLITKEIAWAKARAMPFSRFACCVWRIWGLKYSKIV